MMDHIKTRLSILKDDKLLTDDKTKELEKFYKCLVDFEWDCELDDKIEIFKESFLAVISVGSISASDYYEEREITKEDFIKVRSKAKLSFYCLKIILNALISLDNDALKKWKSTIKTSLVQVIIFCACFNDDYFWSDEDICQLSREVIELTFKLCNSSDWNDLLQGSETTVFTNGFAKAVMVSFISHFKPNEWKKSPVMKYAFRWCLFHIKYPFLGNVLQEVLPPSLCITDDYLLENKIIGVTCLNHIIENIIPTDLKLYGRADVIFSTLEHLLYTQEPELITILHPCLLKILVIVEDNILKPAVVNKNNKYDIIMQKMLTDLEYEQKIIIRRTISEHLHCFIDKMGITIVKHLRRLIIVITQYLEVYDGPEEISRKNILKALHQLLIVAWPRIPFHSVILFKSLIKLMYDIKTDDTNTPESVKTELYQMAFDCIILLKRCSPQLFEKDVWGKWIVENNNPAQSIIQNIINTV